MDREALKAELAQLALDCDGGIEQFMTQPPRPIGVRIPLERLEEFVQRAAAVVTPARKPFASIRIDGALPLKEGHFQAEVIELDVIQTLGRDIDEPFVVYLPPPQR